MRALADYQLIEQAADLEAIVQDLLQEKTLAFDTEADSFYHYFDKTCLIQIATRRQIFLVDPIAMGGPEALAPLGPVMASPDVRKVFHAAEYDIFVLKRDCRFRFANLYDTMVSARSLDPQALSLLRELFLERDKRAREIDRPPFKVLGNRTLIEIAQRQPTGPEELSRIKGVTDLILRRFGRDMLAAVKRGLKRKHGPIPKGTGNGRRRMDRRTERRLGVLKRWRAQRAREVELDPGVLCPNAALEAIAFKNPTAGSELVGMEELKGWFAREFGDEVADALGELRDEA